MNRDQHDQALQSIDRQLGYAATWNQAARFCVKVAKAVMFVCFGMAALTFANAAQARDIAAIPNNAGGQIILTDIPSTNGNKIAYSRGADGTTIFGYWVPGENFIIVKWDGGSLKTFEYDDFEPLPRQMLAPAATPDMRL